MSKKLSHEDFVTVWQTSASLGEVSKQSKMTPREASLRAYHLRKAGVPLKLFKVTGKPIDVAGLTALVRKIK